ncbi:chitooligosaccharide deacetylase NodB [Mesorhizobium abyssinicae]|uniref:chitooligosaccharide deacetylase NodB n=1 Tax=Mesorhizobium abyssinicae TaxID=1209958 RepID=UPI0033948403
MTRADYLWDVRSECEGGASSRSVYFTFDDGPNPHCTPQILDVLAKHRIRATFFVIGAYVVNQPELIQRMVAEGHEVGNHTMTHPDLSTCGLDEVQREIFETNGAIMKACPQTLLRYVRAPYGIWTEEVFAASAIADLAALHWSLDSRDWSRPGADVIVEKALEAVKPGAIILFHDGCPPDRLRAGTDVGMWDQTTVALTRLIPALLERGFEICPLPDFQ